MKISAAALAAMFAVAPAFAGDWAPQVNADTLSAAEFPAPPAPDKAAPKDGQNYSGAEELLIKEFAVTRISLDIPEHEVMRQDRFYENAFCFEHALRLALSAALESYDEATSPLARELARMGAPEKPSKSELKAARRRLLGLMNRPESFISLVRPYKQYQPQNGEMVEQNWIFYLRLEGASYWAVVDRSGAKPAYIYGMN